MREVSAVAKVPAACGEKDFRNRCFKLGMEAAKGVIDDENDE